jgi:hypothetical protein
MQRVLYLHVKLIAPHRLRRCELLAMLEHKVLETVQSIECQIGLGALSLAAQYLSKALKMCALIELQLCPVDGENGG